MHASARFAVRASLVAAFMWRPCAVSAADEPLHELIDQRLATPAGLHVTCCSDAEFLRRVSLDLTGMPPRADEARVFLIDSAADKRAQLIDRLLASPQYVRHLAATIDVMLMERRRNQHVEQDAWQAWLLKSVRDNKPWNVLVREVLAADGDNSQLRPAARFYLDRESEPHVITRDIGRIFFGRDLQCAQCHNHPVVDNYLQSDYHGLLAFVVPGYALVRKQGDQQITVHAERAGQDLVFESVFEKGTHRTGPRLPGDVAMEEPFFYPDEEYTVAPADNAKPVPKFSRRAKLAELATNGSNRAFNENIANRFWSHMLGRGIVHPLDMHHPDNPPTDAVLLKLLGEQFAAMNFDIRALLREIALTEVYQRPYDLPGDVLSAAHRAAAEVAELEQQRPSIEEAVTMAADEYANAGDALGTAEQALVPVAAELDAARQKCAEASAKLAEANKALADAQAQLSTKRQVATPVQGAAVAAKQAAKALPDDQELAAAAQTFVDRSEQLAAELAALETAVDEKSGVGQAADAARQEARHAVDLVRARLQPFDIALRQAERTMIKARQEMESRARVLGAFDERLASTRASARLIEQHQMVAAARESVLACQQNVAAAAEELGECEMVVVERQATVQAARDELRAAAAVVSAARAERVGHTQVALAVTHAWEASQAAAERIRGDAILTEVVTKLMGRVVELECETAELQRSWDEAIEAEKTAAGVVDSARTRLDQAIAERALRQQAAAVAAAALESANGELDARQSAWNESVAHVVSGWSRRFALASLKPLTPEQLCWTLLRITGVYDRHKAVEIAELEKSATLTDEQKRDSAALAARSAEIEQRTFDKLKGNLATFIQLYGSGAGQPQGDFYASADQALFAANASAINGWIAPAGGNITERIVQASDPRVAAEELYLAVLSRLPTEQESDEVTAHLASRSPDTSVAAVELVWGLINSAEFRFNH